MNQRTSCTYCGYAVTVASGAVMVVAGNVLSSIRVPNDIQQLGHLLRQGGILLLILAGMVFLIRQRFVVWWRSWTGPSMERLPQSTEGDCLPAWFIIVLRIYGAGLVVIGSYFTLWSFASLLVRPRRGYIGWAYGLLPPFALFVLFIVFPGLLIWVLCSALVRMDQKLGFVQKSVSNNSVSVEHGERPESQTR